MHKFRSREKAFLVEGDDLVAAGIVAGCRPQSVFVVDGDPAAVEFVSSLPDSLRVHLPLVPVDERVASRITSLDSAPAVMAVFPELKPTPWNLLAPEPLIVYADRIADPGNLGTLVRAAAAFGAAAVVTSPGSVDLFAPKVVRATMGAIFSLPLHPNQVLEHVLAHLGGARVYGLVAHGGGDLWAARLARPAVLCVGAERSGLGPDVLSRLHERVTIRLSEHTGGVESLNAGVAGAIALYEFSRRAGANPTTGV